MDKEKKIYTSFHDIPPRDYMYFPKGIIDVGKPGKFSRVEITQILISMGVLTFIFGLVFSGNNIYYALVGNGFNFELLPFGLGLAFLGIFTAFFFHEISHKFMAQKFGLWAEYRMFSKGLTFAFLLGIFTPFVFAAPGAVMFMGGAKEHETGRIAMVGPLTNIIIAGVTYVLYIFVFFESAILAPVFAFICIINAFIAFFNLLPFGPLDGVKILRWNATVWIIMLIASISILMLITPNLPIIS
jgi:Zn-dependent protease